MQGRGDGATKVRAKRLCVVIVGRSFATSFFLFFLLPNPLYPDT